MDILTHKKDILRAVIIAAVCIVVALAARYHRSFIPALEETVSDVFPEPSHEPVPRLFISGTADSYAGGGMIALSSLAEPAVYVSGDDIKGEAQISLYRASEEALLGYLTHDKDGQQLERQPAENQIQFVTTLSEQVSLDRGTASKVLLPLDRTGIWFVKVKIDKVEEVAFIVRSNVGAVVKEGDNQYLFWAQDFTTRRSIPSGNVAVYNMQDTAQLLAQSAFNREGIASTNLLPEADIAVVHAGSDVAVVPINLRYLNADYQYRPFQRKLHQTTFFTFTDRPIYKPGDTIYFKSILRDDDDVRYTIPSEAASVEIYNDSTAADPLYTKSLAISREGTIAGEYTLSPDVPTGYYSLSISLPTSTEADEYARQDSTSFQVEHFRKPEYSIDVTTPTVEFTAGDKAFFDFLGQPLAEQKVSYVIRSSDFYDYEYQPYNTELGDDFRYGYWGETIEKEGEATFDAQGKAHVELPTKFSGQQKTKIVAIEATFDDGSGNPSFARKNVLVYAGDYNIYRTDGQYGSKVQTPFSLPVMLVSNNGADVSGVSLKAAIHRSNWVYVKDKDNIHGSYTQEEEDLPSLAAKTNAKGEATFVFTPPKIGSYTITVSGSDKRGNGITKDFSLWVSDGTYSFYTPGEEGVQELTLQADKETYEPDETATLTVTSVNVPDRDVLLSFERGRVNRYQVVHLTGNSTTVSVALVATDMPNIGAKVSSFGDNTLDTSDLNIVVSPERKKLIVDLAPDKITYGPGEIVTVNVETKDTKGKPVSAETAVWAVDKAIFELADEKPEKIFDTFWQERYNNTDTAHSLEGILAYGGAEKGGCFAGDTPILMGDGSTKAIQDVKVGDTVLTRADEQSKALVKASVTNVHGQNVMGYLIFNGTLKVTPNHRLWVNGVWQEAGNVEAGDLLMDNSGKAVAVTSIEWQQGAFTVYNLTVEKYHTYFANGVYVHNQKGGGRTIFKDTAYWNPSVRTDANGKAQVRFTLPDNLTTWRLAAVGSTVDTMVGQTSKEIVVTKDIVIRPVVPNILRQGDTVVLEAILHNFTDTAKPIVASLQLEGADTQTPTDNQTTLAAGETKTLSWVVIPRVVNEAAKVTFSVKEASGKLLDGVTQVLPVKAFGFFEKHVQTGIGAKSFSLSLAPDSDPSQTSISLSLSANALGTLPEAMKYLLAYPYGCVEQTTSRLVPALIAKRYPALFKQALSDKDLDKMIAAGLDRLLDLQQSDGGWSWWYTGTSDPFVSAYVVDYLVEAKSLGIVVDEDMYTKAQSYFESMQPVADERGKEYGDKETQIIRAFALSRLNSGVSVPLIADLQDLRTDIVSLAVMANVANGYTDQTTNGVPVLLAQAQRLGEGLYWGSGDPRNFGSDNASTAFVIRALVAAGGHDQEVNQAARLLTANRSREYWANTFGTSQVIRALTEMAQKIERTPANYAYTVAVDGVDVAKGKVTSADQVISPILIPTSVIKPSGSTISLFQEGNGQLYSTLVVNEFRTSRDMKEASNGLSITREYVNERGPGLPLMVGDLVSVNLRVNDLADSHYYGVIDDKLPAGLIPVNTDLKNEEAQADVPAYFDSTDQEVGLDGVVIYPYTLYGGGYTYSYKARVISQGTFFVPPVTASLMYAPEVNGRSGAQTVIVLPQLPFSVETPQLPTPTPLIDEFGMPRQATSYTAMLGAIVLLVIVVGGLGVVGIIRARTGK
jgi:uncharacterized protein YfaS (alpha-2-macroglobulin family)